MREELSIITRAQQGDATAFGEIYDIYLPRIYRFIFLKVGRKQDAEDLVHQVFMNAWEHIRSYESQGFPFSSWLYRIANNAVIDYYRTFKGHQSIDTVPEETFAEHNTLEKDVDRIFVTLKVRTALQKLDSEHQNVLIMRFIDERTTKEIAETLGKTEGAVRVLQHRALKQLQQYVDTE